MSKHLAKTVARLENLASEKAAAIRRVVSEYELAFREARSLDPTLQLRKAREIEGVVGEYSQLCKALKRLRKKTGSSTGPPDTAARQRFGAVRFQRRNGEEESASGTEPVKTLPEFTVSQSPNEQGSGSLLAKRTEVRLATAELAQAEYDLCALESRIDYLAGRRVNGSAAATGEEAELERATKAAPATRQIVVGLSAALDLRKRELEMLLGREE